MNIISAFIAFDILMIVYEIIIEIFSALYELSGLTKEQARFQVTSLLTGTGFTTAESEAMLKTKKRKRVTRDIMIISYIFNITIISTLVAIFTSMIKSTWHELIINLLISSVIIIILFFSRKIAKIRIKIDKIIMYLVNKFLYNKDNPMVVYDYYGGLVLAEVKLNKVPAQLAKKSISKNLLKYDLKIFFIYRDNQTLSDFTSNFKLKRKDRILILGKKKDIANIFLKQ